MSCPHNDFLSCPFQLKYGVVVLWRKNFILRIPHVCAAQLPPLQDSQAVSVQCRVNARSFFIVRLADHQPDLAVRVCSLAEELEVGGNDEVTTQLIVDIMKFVPLKPDVVT